MKTMLDVDELVFNPPELGGVLYLPGPSGGGSKIYDRSPYGNAGTITGATWTRLPSGLWVLSFDGVDDYVDCGDRASLDTADAITIMAWAKPTDVVGTKVIAARRIQPDVENPFYFALLGDKLNFAFYVGGVWKGNVAGVDTLSAGLFSHLAVTYNRAQYIYYINGIEDVARNETAAMPTGTDVKLMLGNYDGGAQRFSGYIALLYIYNRALSALEIQNHFNQEKRLFGVW